MAEVRRISDYGRGCGRTLDARVCVCNWRRFPPAIQAAALEPSSVDKPSETASLAPVLEKMEAAGTNTEGHSTLPPPPPPHPSENPPATTTDQKSPSVDPPSPRPPNHPPPSRVALSSSPNESTLSNGVARGDRGTLGSPGSNSSEDDRQEEEEEEEEEEGGEKETESKRTPGLGSFPVVCPTFLLLPYLECTVLAFIVCTLPCQVWFTSQGAYS